MSKIKHVNAKLMGGDVHADVELLHRIETTHNKQNIEYAHLLEYQQSHANKLIEILKNNGTALDSSDPGAGKTYIASYIAKVLNLQPIIVCPKNVISRWEDVMSTFGVMPSMTVNYELIARGKQYVKKTKVVSPHIIVNSRNKRLSYDWNVPDNTIFIFDEAHKCKYARTRNARLLLGAKKTGNKILLLSGTIVEKPTEFAIFGYILGFSNSLQVLTEWLGKLTTPAKTLHTLLFSPDAPKASRISISELGDKFPETQITADSYTMKKSADIRKQYEDIINKIEEYKSNGKDNKFIMAKLQNEFRNIELMKIPTFVELANDYIENDRSVVIFVNYTDTLNLLAKKFKTDSKIYGGQHLTERDKVIENFQKDKTRIVIANIKAGGVGISLHDVNGQYPRVALISPTQSSTDLMQVLGRVHRAGGKTKSLQRIIFAADTPEENLSKLLHIKLSNLALLNDGDIESYYIEGLSHKSDKVTDILTSKQGTEHDLRLIIDAQFARIQTKNIKLKSSICQLFPNVISIISGVDTAFILKGTNIFDDVEILLAGEIHTSNKPCKTCNKTCVEILDLIAYITHSVNPNIVDFYIESSYNSRANDTNKFENIRGVVPQSRMRKLYESYKHLFNIKHPATENLRMHVADVRDTYHPDDDLLNTFADLIFLGSILIWSIPDIGSNKLEPTKELKVDYTHNVEFFDNFVINLKSLVEQLNNDNNMQNYKRIFYRDENVLHALKIAKQRVRFVESYDNNKMAMSVRDKIENCVISWFDTKSEIIYNWLKNFISFMVNIATLEPEAYINTLMNECRHNTELFSYFSRNDEHPADLFSNLLSTYMDQYTVYRMLRKFDNVPQKNIVFYGGSFHSDNILQILLATNCFKLVAKKIDSSKRYEIDCAHISHQI